MSNLTDHAAWIAEYEKRKENEMSFNASKDATDFEIPEPGVYAARCYRMIDLGHQQTSWQGKPKIAHKIFIAWELLDGDRMADGKPFSVASRYTLSLSDNAHLKKALESWRGKPFTLEENLTFDVSKVLGAYCLLNIVHAQVGENTYANVASIMPLPKQMEKPAGVNPLVKFDVDEPDMAVFETLSQKMQDTIKACEEWQKKGQAPAPQKSGGGLKDMDDDIPF